MSRFNYNQVFLLLTLLTLHGSAQLRLQCPIEESTVSDGVITFGELSAISPVLVVHKETMFDGWYSLANGFASGVGSSQLPYGKVLRHFNPSDTNVNILCRVCK